MREDIEELIAQIEADEEQLGIDACKAANDDRLNDYYQLSGVKKQRVLLELKFN